MKKLTNLHMLALAMALTILTGTSVFAGDPSDALNTESHLLSANDFSALSGVSADPLNEAELDEVQGKYLARCIKECLLPIIIWDNPLCWVDGCGGPGPLFDLRGQVSKFTQASNFHGGIVSFNPQPDPPKISENILF